MFIRLSKFPATERLLLAAVLTTLAACGGGSSSSDSSSSSSPVVARGAITQLGSIYVNGVKYETPASGSYSSDDSSVGANAFKVGQVVSLRGRLNDDGATGVATRVEYEAEIEGAALGGQIGNVTILITPKTNTSEIIGFGGSLVDGVRYEVSGLWLDNSTIDATFIKIDDDGDGIDEIKGFVEAVNPGVSLTVHGVTYSYGGPTVVAVGDYVEIHFNGSTASSVELEDDFFDQAEDHEIEIEGAVNLDTTDCPTGADFRIDMTCIDYDNKPAQWLDGLAGPDDIIEGSRVEAEGHMNGGLLVADKIKGRGNRVRIESIAGSVNTGSGTFQLIEGNIDISTMNGFTVYEDSLNINNINGQEVEVRGIRTGPTAMLAERIKSTGLSGGGDRHEIRAEIDENGASDPASDRITVMGITAVANSFTELEIEDVVIAPGNGVSPSVAEIASFLGLIDDDTNPSNGPRDVVEVGFDIDTGDGQATPYTAEEIEIEEEDD